MFKGIFIKNFFNLIINQGINIVIALLATRILFSTLGEAQYGLVNLALSVVLLSSITVSYGYHLNGPKRIALFRDESAKKANFNQRNYSNQNNNSHWHGNNFILLDLFFRIF